MTFKSARLIAMEMDHERLTQSLDTFSQIYEF